jgi:hypothetical protein
VPLFVYSRFIQLKFIWRQTGFLVDKLEKKRAVGLLLLPAVGFICMIGWVFCVLGEPKSSALKSANWKEAIGKNKLLVQGQNLEMGLLETVAPDQ